MNHQTHFRLTHIDSEATRSEARETSLCFRATPARKHRLSTSIATAIFVAGVGLHSTVSAQNKQDHPHESNLMEEVIVSGALKKSRTKTALPITVLDGEALSKEVRDSLGETLNGQVGIHSASFGSGVGLPVIRGQSGNRVRVLQSGIDALDASAVSPDHSNSITAFNAERVEVIRGPATLLYGNGAIGGIVNVIDGRIKETLPEDTSMSFTQTHDTNNDGNTSNFRFDTAVGNVAFHLDGAYVDTGIVEIPGYAQLEDEHHDDDHDDEEPGHDEHEEEHEENTDGFIGNSETTTKSLAFGSTYVGETGFVGFSVSRLERDYGLPPGTHAHGEEEHEGEEGDEGEEHEEHGEVNVNLDMEQTRYEFKAGKNFEGWLQSATAHLAFNDYEHFEREMEIHEEGEEHGDEDHDDEDHEEELHEPTRFSNEGVELRLQANHAPMGNLQGTFGLQYIDREFSVIGEEAFLPTTDINTLGVFVVESIEADQWTYEFGARVEDTSFSKRGCDVDNTTYSASGSAIRELNEQSNIFFGLSRSERSPTEQELFSNSGGETCGTSEDLVLHVSTNRFEIGTADLDTEVSSNFEIGYRKFLGEWRGEVNAYYNSIDDFIYLQDTDVEIDESTVSVYQQQDATFYGYEAQLSTHFIEEDAYHLDFTLFTDAVRAEFDGGENVPRIPAMRVGTELALISENWSARLRLTEVDEQTEVAHDESETDGYTLLNLYADYHIPALNDSMVVFVRGNNLLDEEIRYHTSLIKDLAPAPGIGFDIGIRINL
ncbi:TonB-dependent receptor [Marinibactrum halimedae]|uniref:TonB-dependent receptor n=1 Tax=Marinibactrum halimedae TaxID=1444977 RepID=A0AA37T569_9GAMM|nr:TonB-dependent receptor [Marinibactrum halimedae]MCD9459323.1 TonB-dependent receptor [Marinibactrum halimedae]GLS25786.1 TonB-dependent receptor [Marinibactrum halimedae]